MTILERFLTYVQIDTQADDMSKTTPSTAKQLNLLRLLESELKQLGLIKVQLDHFGTLYGELPSNGGPAHPIIGLLAHVDTALEMPGAPVKPRVINNYDGQSIVLNEVLNIILDIKDLPHMPQLYGQTLVVTDGTTLLGADDKAGIAIIIEMLSYLKSHPSIMHGPLRIAFTPDEEIGRGVAHFDVTKFGADYAYTIDGGDIRQLNYENFNASSAEVSFQGAAIHPGYGKGRLINAQLVAMEFNALLPERMIPSMTEEYEGFHHLVSSGGTVEQAHAQYILRNHDEKILLQQQHNFLRAAHVLNKKYDKEVCRVSIKPGYRNMRPLIEQHPEVLKRAYAAFEACDIAVQSAPIRGGTDGATLTYLGIPCPNLGTGGYHAHSKFELVVVEQMEAMVTILTKLVSVEK